MKVLGIDPGSRRIGLALLEGSKNSVKYLDSCTLKCEQVKNFSERLHFIYSQSQEILKRWRPDYIAFEALIYVKSPKSLIKLSQARGAMIAAFAQTHAEHIFEYSPNLVKSVTTGYGHATKESIQKGIQMLTADKKFETDDESDAVAIAFCHLLNADSPVPLTKGSVRRGSGLADNLKHMLRKDG